MKKEVRIRNCVIGSGLPKIVVPVCCRTEAEALRDAEQAVSAGADMVEFRADAFERAEDPEACLQLTEKIRKAVKDLPLLFTFRSAREGGLCQVSPETYGEITACAVRSGLADLVDVEQESDGAAGLVRLAGEHTVPVVMSFHDFRKTPPAPDLLRRLKDMEQAGASVAKIACMPESSADAAATLGASAEAYRTLGIPHVLISMGETGAASRLAAEVFGSAFTFGRLPGGGSAPGQPDAEELRRELERIHEIRAKGGHIFLTGFMGTGKSTVSNAIHEGFGRQLIEMDGQIEREQKRSISDIFSKDGEAAFRDMETCLLAGLYDCPPSVISCGGGAVLRPGNIALMKAMGRIVLLTAEPETVLERVRINAGKRPLLQNRMSPEGIASLMEQRRDSYERAADLVIGTDGKSPGQIAAEIIRSL